MKNQSNYVKVASHEAKKGEFDKCLLLYSGGLDTSVMLKWIQEEYNCDVIIPSEILKCIFKAFFIKELNKFVIIFV